MRCSPCGSKNAIAASSRRRYSRLAGPIVLGLLIGTTLLAGCASKESNTRKEALADSVLTNAARHVIYPTYAQLHTEARSLLVAARALQQRPTTGNLEAARQAWRDTRAAWESAEAFSFGPATTEGFDPAIDSWPVNEADLDRVLADPDSLSTERMTHLGNTEKGFHAIEYLLFGKQSEKAISDFTDRQITYFAATARDLKSTTGKLMQAWSPDADSYGRTFVTAGTAENRTFYSKNSALRQLVVSMAALARKLANEKLGGPLKTGNVRRVESRFSGNSLADFKSNAASLRHLYTGDYLGHDGPGLDEIVKKESAALDERFCNELKAARKALDKIPAPFRSAIKTHPESIRQAQNAARQLARTLDEEIKPLVLAV